ncbi:protein FAM221A-like [Ptychodera flava]|uniref:protein FAM221A-like n=1 Tax=Ptychodera flava TaxID=63121 RepID=UPI003969F599
MADDRRYHMKFGPDAAAHVDAYFEYRKIVGEDDDGKLFTPEEYENYKKTVVTKRMKNRLFVSWTSPSGMDCKMIGPETPCFCTHRYKQHKTDFDELPSERPIMVPCRVKGCKCKSYHYVPLNGSQPIRCRCKHFADDHSEIRPYKCKKGCNCVGFKSSFTCSCGQPTFAHETLIETKEERQARGHPVGYDVPYAAMGGITGFSSLAEGYMRLDNSGIGTPDDEFLNQPIGASDHPFLRMHASTINQIEGGQRRGQITAGEVDQLSDQMSHLKRPGESDMDFYERRYQERQKEQRNRVRAPRPAIKQSQRAVKK